MTRLTLLLGTVAVAAAIGLTAGCGDSAPAPAQGSDASPPTTAAPATTAPAPTALTTPTAPAAEAETTVWYLDAQGGLVPQRRAAELTPEGVIGALAEGPTDPALAPALPSGTRVLGARVDAGVATVDLSGEFAAGYPSGGAAAEIAVIAPIVYSLTELPGVDRVLLRVEGMAPDLAGSQFDFTAPLGRDGVGATATEAP